MPRKWQLIPLAVAVGLLASACGEMPTQTEPLEVAAANFGVDNNAWYEFSGTGWPDACTGELYDWWARGHIFSYAHDDASGGSHVIIHENLRYWGIGQGTGTEFLGTEMQTYHYNAPSSGVETFSDKYWDHAVTKGPAQNTLVVYYQRHVTINANGDVTAYKWEPLEIRCGGADG
jgi:hypothetical protein